MTVRSIASSISAILLTATLLLLPSPSIADGVKADVTVTTSDGYARLMFRFTEETEADVRLSGAVLVISFSSQVDLNLERLTAARDYISAVRRDPDGKGLRIALARKVRLSSKLAGERFFVDLLPDTWTAAAPPLPQDVIDEMIRRARDAERKIKQQQAVEKPRATIVSRVRVSRQPTFVRYLFELPDLVPVTPDRGKDKLTLTFGARLKFDLAEAVTIRSPAINSVEAEEGDASTTVTLSLLGNPEVRTFREETNFVVDVLLAPPPSALDKILPETRPAGARSSQGEMLPDAPPMANLPPPPPAAAEVKAPEAVNAKAEVAKASEPKMAEPPPANAKAPEVKLQEAAKPESKNEEIKATDGSITAQPLPAPASAAETASKEAQTPPATTLPNAAPEMALAPPSPPAAQSAPASAPNAAAPDAPEAKMVSSDTWVSVTQKRQGDTVSLTFPFSRPVSAGVFLRADSLFVVLDTLKPLDVGAIHSEAVRNVTLVSQPDFQVVHIKLDRPRLVSASLDGAAWTVHIGDTVVSPGQPLALLRTFSPSGKASALVPAEGLGKLRRFKDPEIGDDLVVVTAPDPVRGLPKAQDFVDFRALASVHGVVIQPLADDLAVDLATPGVTIGRPGGLVVTSASPTGSRSGPLRTLMFDTQQWGFDRQAEFLARQQQLIDAAADAPETRRTGPRLDLARFYFAREMYVEAKGVLDVILADDRSTADDTVPLVMHGIAQIMIGRPDEALKDLNQPIVGTQSDADLWRTLAYARQGKWAAAHDGFAKAEVIIARLPIELQRVLMSEAIHASIEVGDFGGAKSPLDELETLGVPNSMKPAVAVLTGRIEEGLGQNPDALEAYRKAADSSDRAAASQGRLREVALRYKLGDLKSEDVVTNLEGLTTAWRGDETEAEALQLLSRLYTEQGRYRDAFEIMRVAMKAHPNSEMTRRIQDEAMRTFDALFLGGKGDALPPIDALSMFYDFKDLTPIGRRGDEMIRRLADRLVSVDLLDQAAELLQHQVDHRLQGAARAQVASRLAVIYLMNRKPDRAIQTLRSTRTSELSSEVRNQRLLIEARALADIGRANLALEVIENVPGSDAMRLRSDILWLTGNYRGSAEQTELLYANRWSDWTPLNDTERRDILRAAIGFSLASDTLGLQRFREKFGPGMLQSPDRQAFQVATAPIDPSREEFKQIVRSIAAIDPLDQFVREMRAKQPENPEAAPQSQLQPDRATTGSIARARLPRSRALN